MLGIQWKRNHLKDIARAYDKGVERGWETRAMYQRVETQNVGIIMASQSKQDIAEILERKGV